MIGKSSARSSDPDLHRVIIVVMEMLPKKNGNVENLCDLKSELDNNNIDLVIIGIDFGDKVDFESNLYLRRTDILPKRGGQKLDYFNLR